MITLVGLQSVEHWTLVEHAIEELKSQGPVGVFLAGVLLSPILPLVLALGIIVIVIEMWRKQGEAEERKRVDGSIESLPSKVSVENSGNSTATAKIGDIHIHPGQSLPPILPVLQREEYFPVSVEFEPSEAQSDKMYLRITNRGRAQMFEVQCKVIERRNDPNPPYRVTIPLSWEHPHGRALHLLTGQSGNVLVASAGENRSTMMGWMRLESASSTPGPESTWNLTPRELLPEYDVEITVLGQQSDQPQKECFTVRAGKSYAIEMYHPLVKIESPAEGQVFGKREIQVRGSVTIPRARIELRVFDGGRWYHNGYWNAQGRSWTGTCWLGDKDSIEGTYTIVAIADGDMDWKQKYTTLPRTGCHSNGVTVTLKRTISEARLADLRSKIKVVSLLPEPKSIYRGKTLKIIYLIESAEDVSGNLWLGASFQNAFEPRQDKSISLMKGVHEYERELTIPANAPPGTHKLQANVWCGVVGDSTKADIVAPGEAEIVIVA